MTHCEGPVILIVEDEFLIREDAAETIEKAGFAVIQARNADEAIAILEVCTDIHVVFDRYSDAGLDGRAQARPLRSIDEPDTGGILIQERFARSTEA